VIQELPSTPMANFGLMAYPKRKLPPDPPELLPLELEVVTSAVPAAKPNPA
jgi:hypothetical protein